MGDETSKYERMIERHLAEVFSEVDDTKRMTALHELYAEDAVLYEPTNVVRGIEAISATVSELLKNFPPQFRFVASGPALIHHEMCCAPWTAGTPDQANMVTGYDVVQFANGRIQSVYVFINPSP